MATPLNWVFLFLSNFLSNYSSEDSLVSLAALTLTGSGVSVGCLRRRLVDFFAVDLLLVDLFVDFLVDLLLVVLFGDLRCSAVPMTLLRPRLDGRVLLNMPALCSSQTSFS